MTQPLASLCDAYRLNAGEVALYADLLRLDYDPALDLERLRKERALRHVIARIDDVPELSDWLTQQLNF